MRENELTIRTFEFEGAADQVALEFLTVTDLEDGRSRLDTLLASTPES